jgi:S-formylglutathione hydrolase
MRGLIKVAAVVGGLMAAAGPAAALDGKLTEVTIRSANVPGPVAVTIYTPPGYDPKRAEPYPLLIQLHGGGGSNKNMNRMAPLLEEAIKQGLVPPMVSVMPSAGRSFYMDYRDGSQKWEQFVLTDLLPNARQTLNVAKGRRGTFITGISMGGMGSLRIAFKHPEIFQAVASQEPGIEPALAFDDVKLRDRFWRSDALLEQIYGKPVDKAYWAANNPASIAAAAPNRLVGLGIYLEAGDQDMFFLQHGTEFVHRILFDAGIAHEYRLVRGAEHVGPSINSRFLNAMDFIGRQINPPAWINDEVANTRKRIDGQKQEAGYPVIPVDPERIRNK